MGGRDQRPHGGGQEVAGHFRHSRGSCARVRRSFPADPRPCGALQLPSARGSERCSGGTWRSPWRWGRQQRRCAQEEGGRSCGCCSSKCRSPAGPAAGALAAAATAAAPAAAAAAASAAAAAAAATIQEAGQEAGAWGGHPERVRAHHRGPVRACPPHQGGSQEGSRRRGQTLGAAVEGGQGASAAAQRRQAKRDRLQGLPLHPRQPWRACGHLVLRSADHSCWPHRPCSSRLVHQQGRAASTCGL
mmetsp:Transcript_7233/g.17474  ORF Transcript_7233/g.17474 Transcript_7233/m.17474 type:complete len:246 (+) Transcript_7233:982-1719(+)